ncbi:Alpha/Beta hydrolase protein [Boletus edulis BED1]|uniref:Alpha/Beta hydrolase protein n=1 Tax=Boletus edulis BED1 TaxID=1328754 RepID=A0AAD4BDQ4_BOLED|nr:Alpha/Beta hydrolase protein [Boletus edulis BED1]
MSESPFTESWLTGPQATQFFTRAYSPSSPAKAAVVFVHGFAEHIARYEHVFPTWSSRGIAVFAYDQRGFGRTAQDEQHKSKNSAYGKTSWTAQLEDLEWAVQHTKQQFPDVPVFLYGHSMGGALVLAFPTRTQGPPSKEGLASISGIVSTSPLILQTKPASKTTRWIGGKASSLAPSLLIPAPLDPKELCHDDAVGEAYLKDPLIKLCGSLRGLRDMLDGGEKLLAKDYAQWPRQLPVLLVHGTEDKMTSSKATEKFYGLLSADDKTFSPYVGGFHELHNEPDGVKEKLTEECIAWVVAHLSSGRSKL